MKVWRRFLPLVCLASVLLACVYVYGILVNDADKYTGIVAIGSGLEQYRARHGMMPKGLGDVVDDGILPEASLMYTMRATGFGRAPRSYRECEYGINISENGYRIVRPEFKFWFRRYPEIVFVREIGASGRWSGGFAVSK